MLNGREVNNFCILPSSEFPSPKSNCTFTASLKLQDQDCFSVLVSLMLQGYSSVLGSMMLQDGSSVLLEVFTACSL